MSIIGLSLVAKITFPYLFVAALVAILLISLRLGILLYAKWRFRSIYKKMKIEYVDKIKVNA